MSGYAGYGKGLGTLGPWTPISKDSSQVRWSLNLRSSCFDFKHKFNAANAICKLFDWTSRSSLFWFELSEDNEVWRRCFLFVLFYLISMWFPLRIFWLNRPRVQAGAQADCAAHAIAGSGWKKTAIVVTGAIPAWWPSSAVGLVTVLLASRFDWVIVLHISIFPYFLTVQSVRGAAYLGAANFCFGFATATATIFLR